jgi:hypothetical protein
MKYQRSLQSPRRLFRAARAVAAVAAATAFGACHEPLDTTRKPVARLTFGDDLYGVLCDRLGADILREDRTGASYQGVCHPDSDGVYADAVDESVLPPPSGAAATEARRVSVAKMAALAQRRGDLVRAFNATFPDVDIEDPSTEAPSDTVNLLDAMMDLGQRVSALYEENPYKKTSLDAPLAPAATRALGDLFAAIGENEEARQMLTRMWARKGYRPSNVGLGVVKGTLSYPDLRDFTTNAVQLLGPAGEASPELTVLLDVLRREMQAMNTELSTLPLLDVDPSTAQPNRPRTTIEIARQLMLTEDPRFAKDPGAPPRFIAVRDKRGYAIPLGDGFVDLDANGSADVDAFGRFVDAAGAVVTLDPPFAIPGQASLGPVDEFGRPEGELYRYVDTTRTPAATVIEVVAPLVDPTRYAPEGDPSAFQTEFETLMYAMAALPVLLGPREDAEYDFEEDRVVPVGTNCPSCLEYSRFRAEDSPIVHLVHALGQVLADQESDQALLALIDLAENDEAAIARVLAAALRAKDISDEHDAGPLPAASLPYENPLWDEAAQILSDISEQPRLVAGMLDGLADPVVVTPFGASNHLGDTMALFAATRDELTYDPGDPNGPAKNLTAGGYVDPQTLVDWTAPRNGTNRSNLERSLLLMHDTGGARTCNRDGAVVRAKVGFLPTISWPIVGDYGQCELFEIPNLGAFFLGAVMQPAHPKRSEFALKDDALNGIMDLLVGVQDPDDVFEDSSGLTGMTTHPTPNALMRLVFFGASSDAFPNMPDLDLVNQDSTTNEFISNLMDPAATTVCDGQILCASPNDTIRIRGRNSIFAWERRGFIDYLRPVLTAFVNVSCSEDVSICDKADFTGENLFFALANAFYRHFPGEDHGAECSSTVAKTDPRYCSGAGLNRYEPIIEKAMRTDLIPALHELAKVQRDQVITIPRRTPNGPATVRGSQVMERLVKVLFSQTHSASVGLTDLSGGKTATWTDGTSQAQTTPYNLFADALRGMDVAFDEHPEGAERKAQWRRARSNLVDALLATEGEGAQTRFKIRGLAPLLATTLRLFREQLNAHCPNRESGVECTWAREELARNLADALSSPLTARIVDLGEKLRTNEPARRALGRYLTHILTTETADTLPGTLASMVDVMQVLADDEKLVPIMRAASVALEPNVGAADTALGVLKALSESEYDRYHVMDHVLANLVEPVAGPNGEAGLSPIETFMDVIAEVHRVDPTSPTDPMSPTDYAAVMRVMEDFMLSETRGLEQIYTIVRKRKRQ